jgi:Holliday junction resolvasome RuvABC endonuclease subunit
MLIQNYKSTNNYIVLGIDPGINHLGVAILSKNYTDSKIKIEYVKTFHTETYNIHFSNEEIIQRFNKIKYLEKLLFNLLMDYYPNKVITEVMYFNKFPQSFRDLTECIYMIQNLIYNFDSTIEFEKIEASKVKQFLKVSGKSGDKLLVKEKILKLNLLSEYTLNDLDEHSLDAIGIAYYGLQY